MTIEAINNYEDYLKANKRAKELIDCPIDGPENDEFNRLSDLILEYEAKKQAKQSAKIAK